MREKEIQKKAEKPSLCGLKQCLSWTHQFESLDLGKGRLRWNAQECHGRAGALSERLCCEDRHGCNKSQVTMCCRRSRGAATSLGSFFLLQVREDKDFGDSFWSHKPSLAWRAKSALSTLRHSEASSELIRWDLDFIKPSLRKPGLAGEAEFQWHTALSMRGTFFSLSPLVPGTLLRHLKAPEDSAVPCSLQTASPFQACLFLKDDDSSLWLIWN